MTVDNEMSCRELVELVTDYLEGTLLATFDQERTRVDAMMAGGTPSRYAQTR